MRRGDQIAAVEDDGDVGQLLNIDQIHRVVSVLITCLLRRHSKVDHIHHHLGMSLRLKIATHHAK